MQNILKKVTCIGLGLILPFLMNSKDDNKIIQDNLKRTNSIECSLSDSQFMKYVDPSTKLPYEKYLIEKQDPDFTIDKEGVYISKHYNFGKSISCFLFFKVNDLNYTKNENEIGVLLNKYPKYIRVGVPHISYKTFIDEKQNGIDGAEQEHSRRSKPKGIGINYTFINKKGSKKNLESYLNKFLDKKTKLPKSELLTEKPLEITFMGQRVQVAKNYLLESVIDEEKMNVHMKNCIMYFPVNYARFDKKEQNKITLELNPYPSYINLFESIYHSKEDRQEELMDSWFIDPKMNSINGDEISEEELLKKKNNYNPSKTPIIPAI